MTLDPDVPPPPVLADFALMETQPGALERYWRLAVDTLNYQKRLKEAGFLDYTTWSDVSDASRIGAFLSRIAPEHRDEALVARWEAWGLEYQQAEAASPKWRLKAMISDVSETHHYLSWPKRWERDIWEWATATGENVLCPFDDRRGFIDPGFRDRMRALIDQCEGFLYQCEETGQIAFAPTETLPAIWRHQDHLAAIARDRPFGFFDDMSRPDWRNRARELTEAEQQMLKVIRSHDKRGGRLRRILCGLRRFVR